MSFRFVTEEYKANKSRLVMMLRESADQNSPENPDGDHNRDEVESEQHCRCTQTNSHGLTKKMQIAVTGVNQRAYKNGGSGNQWNGRREKSREGCAQSHQA